MTPFGLNGDPDWPSHDEMDGFEDEIPNDLARDIYIAEANLHEDLRSGRQTIESIVAGATGIPTIPEAVDGLINNLHSPTPTPKPINPMRKKEITADIHKSDFALLLAGAPGTGKTTLAISLFPNPYVFDADHNLGGPTRHLHQEGIKKDIYYDKATLNNEDNPIDKEKRYDRMIEKVMEACDSDDIDTIILDSLTSICQMLMDKLLGRRKKMEYADWAAFALHLKDLITQLRQFNKLIVFTCHISSKQDEADNRYHEHLAIPGQMRDIMSGLFSDVWLTYVTTKGHGANETATHMVRTIPTKETDNRGIKDSLNMPSTIPANQIKLPTIL